MDPNNEIEIQVFKTWQSVDISLKNDPSPLRALDDVDQFIKTCETKIKENMVDNVAVFITQTIIPQSISRILKRDDYDTDAYPRIHELIQNVLQFAISVVQYDIHPIMNTVLKIYTLKPNYIFYSATENEHMEKGQEGLLEPYSNKKWSHRVPTIFLTYMDYFGHIGGYSSIISRIQNPDLRPIPLSLLKLYMKFFYNLKELFIVDHVKSFSKALQKAVQTRLTSLSDDDIKHEDRNTTTNILFFLEHFSQKEDGDDYYGSLDFDLLRLTIANQFLRCSYLEKKIAGLSDIRNVIERFQNSRKYGNSSSTIPNIGEGMIEEQENDSHDVDKYLNWLFEHQILEYLFGDTSHPEIMKRSKEIIKFIASEGRLLKEHINMIWNFQVGKHETVCQIIWGVIGELAPELSLEIIIFLFDKIRQFQMKDFNFSLLSLVREVSIRGIQLSEELPEGDKNWYGLEIFWSLIQDESGCPVELIQQSHSYLFEFLHWNLCEGQRMIYLMRCVDNIKLNRSVSSSLRIIQDLISNIRHQDDEKEILMECLEEESIIDLVASNLFEYKKSAKEKAKEMNLSPSQINQTVFAGKYMYTSEIQSRLSFTRFISKHFMLSREQVYTFWSLIIENNLTDEERNIGFTWLRDIGQVDVNGNSISDEDREYVFQCIENLDLSQLNDSGWLTLEFYFRCINWIKGTYFDQSEQKSSFVNTLDLFGLDCLWRVCLEVESTVVATLAIKRVCDIYTNHPADVEPSRVTLYREAFIHRIMDFLSNLPDFKVIKNEEHNRTMFKISRCFSLIKVMMERCESSYDIQRHGANVQGSPLMITVKFVSGGSFVLNLFSNETIRDLKTKIASKVNESPLMIRIIFSGKSFDEDRKTIKECKFEDGQTIHAARRIQTNMLPQAPKKQSNASSSVRESDENILLPSQILSQPKYFDRLFSLLSLPEPLGNNVWDLLMDLPTNDSLLSQINQFDEHVNWSSLLDTENVFKLFYSLQIIESLVKETNERAQQWGQRFKSTGGVEHLFKIFKDANFEFKVNSDDRRITCFALLLKIIDLFILKPRTEESDVPEIIEGVHIEDQFNITPKEMIDKILDTIMSLVNTQDSHDMNGSSSDSLSQEQGANSKKATEQLYIHALPLLVAYVNYSDENMNNLIHYQHLDAWISSSLLNSPYLQIRETTKNSLYQVSRKYNFVFLEKMLALISTIHPHQQTSVQYFDLLNGLIDSYCLSIDESELHKDVIKDSFVQIFQLIETHPIVELRGSNVEDQVIIGLMTVATTIVRNRPDLKVFFDHEKCIEHIFSDFLFTFASPHNNGPDSPPLCKTQKSRYVAFNLLRELTNNCEANFRALVDRMILIHAPRKNPLRLWNYQPTGFDKALCGYVGLTNLGATCYMNSLTQQLYMIPQFRSNILQVRNAKEDPNENTLYQIQNIFANLQESEMNFFDTTPFCDVYKCYGEPMNPRVQMDVDEFFSMLFDKLEKTLKGTGQDNVLKDFFGGVLTNQIKSLECEHTSERNEDFFTMSLDVKNKKRIEESLSLYIQGDLLEGSNKYSCEKCNKKVDARKRCFIRETPNNLIIHLKRFDFDIELLTRSKVNDYCEFPMELNIEPYTKEGIERMENNLPIDEEQLKNYDYDLSGILVHIGTAESGHYYSFIKERKTSEDQEDKWFWFNDKKVDPFDPSDIPDQCFGGLDAADSMYPKKSRRLKNYSAYMLFYTKRIPKNDKVQANISREDLALSVPKELYERTWEENMNFLSDKYVFDPDYLQFAFDIVNHTTIVSESEETFFKGVELGTKFFVETLSHAKDKSLLHYLLTTLYSFYRSNENASRWLITHLIQNTSWIESILMKCIHFETKKSFANLICSAMQTIYRQERHFIRDLLDSNVKETLLSEEGEVIMGNNGINSTLPSYSEIDTSPNEMKTITSPRQIESILIRFLVVCSGLIHKTVGNEPYYSQFFHLFKGFTSLGHEMREYMIANGYLSSLTHYYLSLKSLSDEKVEKSDQLALENSRELISAIADLICSFNFNKETLLKKMVTDPMHIIPIEGNDLELITSKVFLQRLIHDCVHIESIQRIFLLYCYNDINMSLSITHLIIESFQLLNYETFRNIQRIAMCMLSISDELQETRLESFLNVYLRVIKSNLKLYKDTRELSRFLIDLTDTFEIVRELLFNSLSFWIEDLILYKNDFFVRCIAERIVQNLLPWFQAYHCDLQNYYTEKDDIEKEENRVKRVPIVQEDVDSNDRNAQVYQMMINILTNCADALATCNKPRAKERLGKQSSVLYSYFRLLNWLMVTEKQAKDFEPYLMLFMEIYHKCDRELFELDFNKFEMIKFLNNLVEMKDSYILTLIQGRNDPNDIFFEFFISLNSNSEYVEYNNEICAYYYRLLNKCCSLEGEYQSQSKNFLEKILTHRNWNWSTQYLLLESDKYPQVALELLEIIQRMIIHFKNTNIFKSNLDHTLECLERLPTKKIYESPENSIQVLDMLVQDSLQEKLYCVIKRGVEIICKLVVHVIDKKGVDAYDSIEIVLKMLCKLLDWVEDIDTYEEEEILVDDHEIRDIDQLILRAKNVLMSHYDETYLTVEKLHTFVGEMTEHVDEFLDLNVIVTRRLTKIKMINVTTISSDEEEEEDE